MFFSALTAGVGTFVSLSFAAFLNFQKATLPLGTVFFGEMDATATAAVFVFITVVAALIVIVVAVVFINVINSTLHFLFIVDVVVSTNVMLRNAINFPYF